MAAVAETRFTGQSKCAKLPTKHKNVLVGLCNETSGALAIGWRGRIGTGMNFRSLRYSLIALLSVGLLCSDVERP